MTDASVDAIFPASISVRAEMETLVAVSAPLNQAVNKRVEFLGQLGRAAEPGDVVTSDGITFTVDSVEGQRIDRLTVKFQPWDRREQPAEDAASESRDA